MMALLEIYSLTEIIVFLVLLAIAVKSVITFWDWLVGRLTAHFNKANEQTLQQQEITKRFEEYDEKLEKLFEYHQKVDLQMGELLMKIDDLIESDRDDIKAYIVEKYHYFYNKGKIDNYNLDCLEKRYAHYLKEHGNSFIKQLMDELRALDKE